MKLTKKKVLLASLAVCLVAIISFGTLAWFTADDQVTNTFLVANSEDDPDEIFSVDVWEDKTEDDTLPEDKIQDGIEFPDILPGDKHFKEVHIENTGYYPQYVRATVTITGASVWQDVYDAYIVPLEDIVETIDMTALYEIAAGKYYFSYYDAANDAFVYELYYKNPIASGEEIIVFDTVNITEKLDRFQAAEMSGEFEITVIADAVQTKNVGDNVYEAFKTVGLAKTIAVADDAISFADALANDEVDYIIVDETTAANPIVLTAPISNKTLDFYGKNGVIEFNSAASGSENLVITGIVDTNGATQNVKTTTDFTGSVTLYGCEFTDAAGAPNGALGFAGGDITIDNCEFTGSGKSYAIYHSGKLNGSLTVTDTVFNSLGSWSICINNVITGDLYIDGCTFNTNDGVLKVLGGVEGNATFTNNTMNAAGHDGKIEQMVVSTSSNTPLNVAGTKTFANNTLNGAAWNQ